MADGRECVRFGILGGPSHGGEELALSQVSRSRRVATEDHACGFAHWSAWRILRTQTTKFFMESIVYEGR